MSMPSASSSQFPLLPTLSEPCANSASTKHPVKVQCCVQHAAPQSVLAGANAIITAEQLASGVSKCAEGNSHIMTLGMDCDGTWSAQHLSFERASALSDSLS